MEMGSHRFFRADDLRHCALAVAYATGGSFERLIQTTDIADMTKFVSRDQLLVYVTAVFRFFGAA